MREFIKLLSKPHLENYHVRYIYLVDIPEEDIRAQEAFDVIDCHSRQMVRVDAFDFLWNVYSKEW